jgi:hypothetical protein
MAKQTDKTAPGVVKKRQVSKLKPVVYRISLVYLGDSRIKPRMDQAPVGNALEPNPYRCRYNLLRHVGADGGELAVAPLTPIPNTVRTGATSTDDDRAAKFLGAGGTSVNPPADTPYKIMILDNHGTRTAENLTLLGNNGDTNSNPEYYRDRGWLGSVIPAVPFRVVVRKFVGTKQFDLPAGMKVVVQVKDPKEEFEQNDGRRRNLLEEFFTQYNRNTTNPSEGDDNLLRRYALDQVRARDPHNVEGNDATKVLRSLTYAAEPVVDTSSVNPLPQQEFSATATATASTCATRAAEFNLELKKELPAGVSQKPEDAGKKVDTGVADFVLAPWPGGGDNYRLVIGLFKGAEDIRDTKDEGRAIVVEDDEQQRIAKPRQYTTPRMILWRKTEFNICVLANNLTQDSILWDRIIAMYRKMFIEVTRPKNFVQMTRQAWRDMLRANVAQTATTTPIFNDDAHWDDAAFDDGFFPLALRTVAEVTANPFALIEQCSRTAIGNACVALNVPSLVTGDPQTDQRDGNGCGMLMIKNGNPIGPLGAYFGDRCFWFQAPAGVANPVDWATSTCSHEFAHLKSIRHSFTSSRRVQEGPIGVVSPEVELGDPTSNVYELDHDGRDANACLQSYLRPLTAEPCGVCALNLRFYDRKKMQEAGQFKGGIDRRLGPATFFEIYSDGGVAKITAVGGAVTLAVGRTMGICALGPQINYTVREGTNHVGRHNLSYYRDPVTNNFWSKWGFSNNGKITVAPNAAGAFSRIVVTASVAGAAWVKYTLDGVETRVDITVVP